MYDKRHKEQHECLYCHFGNVILILWAQDNLRHSLSQWPSPPILLRQLCFAHSLFVRIVFVNFRLAAVIPPPTHNPITPLISLLIPMPSLSACSSFNRGHNQFVCVVVGNIWKPLEQKHPTVIWWCIISYIIYMFYSFSLHFSCALSSSILFNPYVPLVSFAFFGPCFLSLSLLFFFHSLFFSLIAIFCSWFPLILPSLSPAILMFSIPDIPFLTSSPTLNLENHAADNTELRYRSCNWKCDNHTAFVSQGWQLCIVLSVLSSWLILHKETFSALSFCTKPFLPAHQNQRSSFLALKKKIWIFR